MTSNREAHMTTDQKRLWLTPLLLALAVALVPGPANAAELQTAEGDASEYFSYETWSDPVSPLTADGDEVSEAANLVVEKVLAAYDECADKVSFEGDDVTVGDLKAGMKLVFANAEYYWAASTYEMTYQPTVQGSQNDSDKVKSVNLEYVIEKSQLGAVKKATEKKIDEALSWVDTDTMSDFEVAQALHDYLVRNCAYDTNGVDTPVTPSRTAYGALVNGTCVCQGYSLAYKLLLSRAGVPAVFVASDSMSHSWNMVQIEGSWYHVDVTYDDPVYTSDSGERYDGGFDAEVSHDYFLRSDASMVELKHDGWEAAFTTPSSDYANRSYAVYKGPISRTGWSADGTRWYDNGVVATEHAFFDPDSDAWYWADADGTIARDKDVYIPKDETKKNADGTWGDGKWVRFDEDRKMVKGEDFRYGSWYHFDEVTGEMAHGDVYLRSSGGKWVRYDAVTGRMVYGLDYRYGAWYYFDPVTGAMAHGGVYVPAWGAYHYFDAVTGRG